MEKRNSIYKFAVLFCAFAIVFSITAFALPFNDVTSGHWALDGINYVSDNGQMNGTSTQVFSPNTTINRAMLITVLHRRAGGSNVYNSIPFTDVPSGAYYEMAVRWGYSKGIIQGTSATTFSPNNPVSRQDAAVFLSRYADIIGGYDINVPYVVLNFSDSNQISSYALPALKWAVYRGIMNGKSYNKIEPLSAITRAEFAVLLTRYGTNIEKVIVKKDTLNITNNTASFSQSEDLGHYYITNTHYSRLIAYVNDIYQNQNSKANAVKKSINEKRGKAFSGACFGISAVTILDKYGKIAFNENFGQNAAKMYNVSSSNFPANAESAIIYYHLSQYIDLLKGTRGSASPHSASNDISHAYDVVGHNNGLTLFSYFWTVNGQTGTHGHTVVAKSVKKQGDNYIFSVFNPNAPQSSNSTLTFSKDGAFGNNQLVSIYVLDSFSHFDRVDIDFYNNSNNVSYNAISSQNQNQIESINEFYNWKAEDNIVKNDEKIPVDAVYLVIQLNDAFKLINEKGETLVWNGNSISGDMKTYEYYFIADNEDEPCCMIVGVPQSSQYEYISNNSSSKVSFAVATGDLYMRISGNGMTSASMDISSPKWHVEGQSSELEMAYCLGSDEAPLTVISSEFAEDVTMQLEGEGFVIEGKVENGTLESHPVSGPSKDTIRFSVEPFRKFYIE